MKELELHLEVEELEQRIAPGISADLWNNGLGQAGRGTVGVDYHAGAASGADGVIVYT